ncbi:MAG: DUF2752 domain-containing protein [Bacteroidales bacterium]|nr:DUF2752 domain-containing protein [Bacteroidales bacterium]
MVMVYIYRTYDPASGGAVIPFPKCPFKVLTGLDCPGCGSQRAIHSLLHGDIVGAWRMNAFMIVSIPYILLLLISKMTAKRSPKIYNMLRNKYLINTYLVFTIAWWIGRNAICN